uniref:Peptidase S54 rhomboid domain-containing protein n=1 Tax=Chaetoceros debilis TaxID=122233 RepID=A0A7S3PU80_9STRA
MKVKLEFVLLLSALFVTYARARVNSNAPIIFSSFRRQVPSSSSSSNSWRSKLQNRSTLASSSSVKRIFDGSPEYDDGYDELDRLDKVKREFESMLGGYRPWGVSAASRRPGKYSWTSRLIVTNVIMYGLQMMMPGITRMGAKRSDMIMQGQQLYRLFTPVFLHGSILHLMMNSFSLQNIGPEVERNFGSGRFLATYVAAGIAGNMASAYYTPNPSLGASGAVFGIMGAYYAFLSNNSQFFGRSGEQMMGRVSSTLMMNVIFGLVSPSIDNWAHIGGAVAGVGMAMTFGPKLYLIGLPGGGRIIADKPSVRLPPYLETIPSKVGKRLKRGRRRMQVQRYQSELSATPWRKKRGHRRPIRERRGNARTGSRGPLKPLFGE